MDIDNEQSKNTIIDVTNNSGNFIFCVQIHRWKTYGPHVGVEHGRLVEL